MDLKVVMQYREVRDVLRGYVEYVAIMHGLDIQMLRNKKLNEFKYWTHIEKNHVINYDELLLTVEMGDVREKIVMKFNGGIQFINLFEEKYHNGNYDFKYDYHVNTISISVYNIEQVHKVLSLFEEIGFFAR
jgi:hypothetical protein